ncbi:MAG: hypothetical protein KatS3mg111_4057 [Pirellulaceae bacterium]|nr:MAG: hypothetical protein KatS3mg111_4057 [Pirellulaceae bacterium]
MGASDELRRELPLQTETCFFLLVSVLDIVLTNLLLRQGAIEANPIAAYFFYRWDFSGLVVFKMTVVAGVCVVAQWVARHNEATARRLLYVGIAIVGAVVVYSAGLYWRGSQGWWD